MGIGQTADTNPLVENPDQAPSRQSRRPSSMISSTSAKTLAWYSLSLALNLLPVSWR